MHKILHRQNVLHRHAAVGSGQEEEDSEAGDKGVPFDTEVLHHRFRRNGAAFQHRNQPEPEHGRVRCFAAGIQDRFQPDPLREE